MSEDEIIEFLAELIAEHSELLKVGVIAIIALIIAVCIIKAIRKSIYRKQNKIFKETAVREALAKAMTVIKYEPDSTLSSKTVDEANLFSFVKLKGNDLLEAEYKGHHFSQCDLELIDEFTEYSDNGHAHKVERTIFRGRFMVIDYDTLSNEPVLVRDRYKNLTERQLMDEANESRGEVKGLGGFIAEKIVSALSPGFKKDEIIHTESAQFNSQFKVLCESPVEAFRILTPQMIAGILDTKERLHTEIDFSFKNDKIYIAWEDKKDALEKDKARNKLSEKQLNRIQNDIREITDFFDSFPLKTLK
jgi:hypothetical protein